MQEQLPGQGAGSDILLETTSKQKKIPLWYPQFWGYLNYDSSTDKKLNDDVHGCAGIAASSLGPCWFFICHQQRII